MIQIRIFILYLIFSIEFYTLYIFNINNPRLNTAVCYFFFTGRQNSFWFLVICIILLNRIAYKPR